ncbi:metallo-hydrolase/oxidoreductase, putative [Plasmodium gallinaceum]|uniref:Metallo-hydrolase/oxidoreductase, putative n=1 Tax=Plasmodium gallinaceum TaxID=5849 RepID=A0A1J1GQ94_PLAGA|nr:metallo-hydrolase/oxidoreductase, putative [Plasmodium gallinaceum]CRG94438.1 metallo-hydrolase/oxidoreductase, putative [Plasmodium gallinaceum]
MIILFINNKRKKCFFFSYIVVIFFFLKFSLIYNLSTRRPSFYLINYKNNFVYILNKKKKHNLITKKKSVYLFKIKKNNLKYTISSDKEELTELDKEELVNKIKNGVDKLLFVNRNIIEIYEDEKRELYEYNINDIEKKKKITDKCPEVDKLVGNFEYELHSETVSTYDKLIKNVIYNNVISLKDNYLVKDYIDKIFYNYIHLLLLNEFENHQKEQKIDEKYDDEENKKNEIDNNDGNSKKCENNVIINKEIKDKNINKENFEHVVKKCSNESMYECIINDKPEESIKKRIDEEVMIIVKKLVLFKKILEYLINKYKIEIRDLYIDTKTYDIKVKRNRYEDNNEKKSDWKLIFLGTGSMYPSTSRGTSSFIFQTTKRKYNEAFLFDCGENTFISLQKANIKVSKIKNIFITHLHGDHCLGLISVLTMLRSINKINIYGPEGIYRFLKNNLNSTYSKGVTKYFVYELKLSNKNYDSLNSNTLKNKNNLEYIYKNDKNVYPILKNDFLEINGFSIKHTIPTIGYIIEETNVKNKFNASYINELIKNNYDQLKQCKNLEYTPYKIYENMIRKMKLNDVIIFPDQTKLTFNNAYKEIYKERKIVICQDTCDASNLENFAKDADILIHESTNSMIDLTDNITSDCLYEDNYNIQITDCSQIDEVQQKDILNYIPNKNKLLHEQTNEYTSNNSQNIIKEDVTKDNEKKNLCENEISKLDENKEVGNLCEKNNTPIINEEKKQSEKKNLLKKKISNGNLIESYNKIISERGHSTANMAGNFAKKINAKKLILTHFSQRYIGDNKLKNIIVMRKIENEALESFQANNENSKYGEGKENKEYEEKREIKENEEKIKNNENIIKTNIYEDKNYINYPDNNNCNNYDFNDKKVVAAYDGLIVHIPPQKKN